MLLIPEVVGTLLLIAEKASLITNLQCIFHATLQYSDNTPFVMCQKYLVWPGMAT